MTVTLPYPPSVNALYATYGGRRLISTEGRNYKRTASMMALAAGIRPLSGDVTLTIMLYRPMKRGDASNRIKALEDSLSGVAYHDDAQVRRLVVERFEDKANPRAVVTIEPYLEQPCKKK